MFYATINRRGETVFIRRKTHRRPDGSTYRMFDCPQSNRRFADTFPTAADALDCALRYCAAFSDASNPDYEEA